MLILLTFGHGGAAIDSTSRCNCEVKYGGAEPRNVTALQTDYLADYPAYDGHVFGLLTQSLPPSLCSRLSASFLSGMDSQAPAGGDEDRGPKLMAMYYALVLYGVFCVLRDLQGFGPRWQSPWSQLHCACTQGTS